MGVYIDNLLEAIRTTLGVTPEMFHRLLWTLVIILLYLAVRKVTSTIISRSSHEATSRYVANKSVVYILSFIVLLLIIRLWVGGISGLVTYLAIVSAGLAIAFRAPLVNLAGWLIIILRRPLRVGDRIELNGIAGDVIDIRLFQFSVLEIGNWVDADQSTGRIIHIPNLWVFDHALANYTLGFNFIWNEIPVVVTFESDHKNAKKLLLSIAEEMNLFKSEEAARAVRKSSERYLIFYNNLNPVVWTRAVDIGVELTVRYLCEPRRRRSSTTAMWERILDEFAKHPDIDFAYPTTRFYNNPAEGKPGLKPDSTGNFQDKTPDKDPVK